MKNLIETLTVIGLFGGFVSLIILKIVASLAIPFGLGYLLYKLAVGL